MTPAAFTRPDVDRPIRFRTPQSSRQSSRSSSPHPSQALPRTSLSCGDLEAMTVPLSRYPTKARHGDSRLSIVAANTGSDGTIYYRRSSSKPSPTTEKQQPFYRYKAPADRAGATDDEEAVEDGSEGTDSDTNPPRTSNSSIYSRISNRGVRKDVWAELDDYAAETAQIMGRLKNKLVGSYDQEEHVSVQQFYEANMDLLRKLKDRHKTLDDLIESTNLAASKNQKVYKEVNARELRDVDAEYSASPMTVTFREPFNDSGGGRISPITLWGEEKEKRLEYLEAQLKEANKKWSPKQEDVIEEIEILREERRKAKKLRRMTAPERRGSSFSLKSIGSFKKSRSNSGASGVSIKSSKGIISNFF